MKKYLKDDYSFKTLFHLNGHNGVYIGNHSWIQTDEEVFDDKKIKFRALKPGEPEYITPYTDQKGVWHIALTEV